MICPVCSEKGLVSRTLSDEQAVLQVQPPRTSEFMDDRGQFHVHDQEPTRWYYRCSLGHTWTNNVWNKCRSCDYKGGTDFVQIGQKVENKSVLGDLKMSVKSS